MTTTDSRRSDGTNPKRARAHVGPSPRPNGSDKNGGNAHGVQSPGADAPVRPSSHGTRNGFTEDHGHAHVGPEDTAVLTGQTANPAGAHVGPRLDGNTDTRGLVNDVERAHLAAGYGAKVRELRKGAGLSQVQLAELAGIGVTHISRLEQGRRRPSVDATKALARVLSPVPDPTALEQRLAGLAGESLREGAARRKRRQENKHRREAAEVITKSIKRIRRQIALAESRGLPVSDAMRALAAFNLPERLSGIQDDPGIEGHEPVRTPKDRHEDIRDLIKAATKGRRR